MLIEYPDVHERKRELARLIGVEDRLFVEVEGHPRVYAIADEDLDRENDREDLGGALRALRVSAGDARGGARRRGRQARLRPHELPGARADRAGDAGAAWRATCGRFFPPRLSTL